MESRTPFNSYSCEKSKKDGRTKSLGNNRGALNNSNEISRENFVNKISRKGTKKNIFSLKENIQKRKRSYSKANTAKLEKSKISLKNSEISSTNTTTSSLLSFEEEAEELFSNSEESQEEENYFQKVEGNSITSENNFSHQIDDIYKIVSSEVAKLGFEINFNLRACLKKIFGGENSSNISLEKIKDIFKISSPDVSLSQYACFRVLINFADFS